MLRRFQLEELIKATKNFSQEFLLGSGAFGSVYKGTFDVEGALAIKRAHDDSYQSLEEFRNGKAFLHKKASWDVFQSRHIYLFIFL